MKEIKVRTPVKCSKGHFNYLYYSVANGYVKDVRFAYPLCECDNAEAYKPCGDDELWTGLRDKNIVDIYENDILITQDGDEFPIIFKQGTFCYQIGMAFYDFTPLGKRHQYEWTEFGKSNKVEVVGNIYEGEKYADRNES